MQVNETLVNAHFKAIYTAANGLGQGGLEQIIIGMLHSPIHYCENSIQRLLTPSVGTFSRRCLTGGDGQSLGGHADRSADMKLLVQGDLFQITADLFNVGNIAGSQGDSDAVDHSRGGLRVLFLLGWVGRHDD